VDDCLEALLDRSPRWGQPLAYDQTASGGTVTTKDPIGFAGGALGLYEYVGNDPANHRDPTGLQDFQMPPLPTPGAGVEVIDPAESLERQCMSLDFSIVGEQACRPYIIDECTSAAPMFPEGFCVPYVECELSCIVECPETEEGGFSLCHVACAQTPACGEMTHQEIKEACIVPFGYSFLD
jgi:hypothetical protein